MRTICLAAMIGMAMCMGERKTIPQDAAVEKAQPAAGRSEGRGEVPSLPKEEVLARVGSTVITEGMIEEMINSMPMGGSRFQSPKAKKELLDSLVEMETAYQEAVRQGLDKDKETLTRLDDYRRRLIATRLREKILTDVKASPADVRAEYNEQADRYKIPKKVRVSQIVFSWDKNASESDIAGLKKSAGNILERAKKGEDFASLAKKYSLDQASAEKGGDIGYANRNQLPLKAYNAAMAFVKEGQISDLITGEEDVRILKATEIIPETKKTFEQLKSAMEHRVRIKKQREVWQKYVADLEKKMGIEVYGEKLDIDRVVPEQMNLPLESR